MTDESIHVSGDAEVSAEPEIANITIGITREHDDVGVIRERLAERADELRAALQNYGIPERNVSTQSYTVRQTRQREEGADRPDHTGEHTFVVSAEDVADVGDVIDTALSNGATELGNVEFTVSDETRRDCRDEAIEAAIVQAQQDASAAATASNLTVGAVQDMSVDRARVAPTKSQGEALALSASGDDTAQTQIESGDVTVSASVSIEYALVDDN